MTEYTFKKLPGRDVRRIFRDGKPTDMYLHRACDANGYHYGLWLDGRTLGRFTSTANAKRALILRQL